MQQRHNIGGDEEDRTPGLGIANAALSQLSYIPTRNFDDSYWEQSVSSRLEPGEKIAFHN